MPMRPRGRKKGKQQEAERLFTPEPIARHTGPPASSAPLHDYFASPRPGADANYVVLPRSLMEAMPLPWQQHMHYLLSEFHQAFSHVTWPIYRVQPSRHEKLVDLDEDQLAEVGYLVEIDADGEVVYRNRAGRVVEQPADTTVLVSCLDPIPPPHQPNGNDTNRPSAPRPGPLSSQPPAGRGRPQPEREDTPPSGFPASPPPSGQPGQSFGPTGYQQPGRSRHGQNW
jgi:hypothetical protein